MKQFLECELPLTFPIFRFLQKGRKESHAATFLLGEIQVRQRLRLMLKSLALAVQSLGRRELSVL